MAQGATPRGEAATLATRASAALAPGGAGPATLSHARCPSPLHQPSSVASVPAVHAATTSARALAARFPLSETCSYFVTRTTFLQKLWCVACACGHVISPRTRAEDCGGPALTGRRHPPAVQQPRFEARARSRPVPPVRQSPRPRRLWAAGLACRPRARLSLCSPASASARAGRLPGGAFETSREPSNGCPETVSAAQPLRVNGVRWPRPRLRDCTPSTDLHLCAITSADSRALQPAQPQERQGPRTRVPLTEPPPHSRMGVCVASRPHQRVDFSRSANRPPRLVCICRPPRVRRWGRSPRRTSRHTRSRRTGRRGSSRRTSDRCTSSLDHSSRAPRSAWA